MLRAFCACLALALVSTLVPTGPAEAQYYQQQQQQQRRRQQQHPQPQPQAQPQPQQQPQPQPEPPQAAPQPAPQPAPTPPPAPVPQIAPAPAPAPALGPQAQPRPSEQAPVPVRVVAPAKSAEQLAREREEHDQEKAERETFNNRLMLYSGLLVGVGGLLALVFLAQTLYLLLALRAIGRTASTLERNTATAQRAFLYLATMAWSPAGANVKISPAWANSGTTPTRNLRISTNWKASHGELPADFVFTYARAPERLLLGPGGRSDVGAALIPMRDIQAAIEDRVNLYFWGRATYEDLFEGSEPHFLEFCYRVDASGATPDKIALTFTHYGSHNRSDEDTQRPREA